MDELQKVLLLKKEDKTLPGVVFCPRLSSCQSLVPLERFLAVYPNSRVGMRGKEKGTKYSHLTLHAWE